MFCSLWSGGYAQGPNFLKSPTSTHFLGKAWLGLDCLDRMLLQILLGSQFPQEGQLPRQLPDATPQRHHTRQHPTPSVTGVMHAQALLGQLFPSDRAASMAAAAAAAPGPKPATRKAAEDPRKPETRHSEFKGVHWSVREQTWRAILLHDDKVQAHFQGLGFGVQAGIVGLSLGDPLLLFQGTPPEPKISGKDCWGGAQGSDGSDGRACGQVGGHAPLPSHDQ